MNKFTSQEKRTSVKDCPACGGSGVKLASEEKRRARLVSVLRLARNTLNAKGGNTAAERKAATAKINDLLGDMGMYP